MSTAQQAPNSVSAGGDLQPSVLPTLTGQGNGDYRARPVSFVAAYLLNVAVAALLIWSGHWVVQNREIVKRQVVSLVDDVSPYILPASKTQAGGGGGGGDRDKLQASRGSAPKFSRDQITPPAVVI